MFARIKPFLELCLLRRGPQDVAFSPSVLALALLLYVLVGLISWGIVDGFAWALVKVFVSLSLVVIYTQLVLRIAGHGERFAQSMTAIAASGVVFGLLALPSLIGIQRALETKQPLGLELLVNWVLVFWELTVLGHIYRHALSLNRLSLGVLVALGLLIMDVALRLMLYPVKS